MKSKLSGFFVLFVSAGLVGAGVFYFLSHLNEQKKEKERREYWMAMYDLEKESQERHSEPQLHLEAFKVTRFDNMSILAEGLVKNTGGEKLSYVEAVVFTYDINGEFISSKSTYLDFNPILPNQASPFKSYIDFNPAIKRFSVQFKDRHGALLPHESKK